MPINEAASFELIIASLNMKTWVYPFDINQAQTNVKLCVFFDKRMFRDVLIEYQACSHRCNCGQTVLQIYENVQIRKIIRISGLQKWSKRALTTNRPKIAPKRRFHIRKLITAGRPLKIRFFEDSNAVRKR